MLAWKHESTLPLDKLWRYYVIQLLLVIIYLSFISLGLPDALLGSAWPSMHQELTVPVSYAGVISLIIAVGTIVSSLLCARLVRKLGTGKLTAISVGMTAVALMGFALSHNIWLIFLWAVPYGLGAGSVDAALNHFVAAHYEAKHMSWLHSFWGVGATLGPYIMGACLTNQLGWHYGYGIVSIIQIILTATLIFSLPLWKRAGEVQELEQPNVPIVSIGKLLSVPRVKHILIAFFCYCSLELTAGLWGSSYMVMQKGFSSELAASTIALFYLGITGGRFLSGFLTMHFSNKTMIRFGQGVGLIGIVLLWFAFNYLTVCAGFTLIGMGCAPIYPSLLHQTPDRFGKELSQSMMGLQMASAYVGNTVSPLLCGLLIGNVSSALYPLIMLVYMAAMIIMVEFCNRKQVQLPH